MEALIDETWKPVKNYEGLYEVSDKGRIRSADRIVLCKDGKTKHLKGKMMVPCAYSNGYLFVTLSKDGIAKGHSIHRLVLDTFCGRSFLEVNHKDGDKTNNALDNLEYITHSGNILHSYRALKRSAVKSWLGKRGFDHNKSIGVRIMNVITGKVERFGSFRLAAENGYNREAIRNYIDTNKLYRETYLFFSI